MPNGPLHFFEGDGMLHSLKLSGGQATHCSRYVKTYKYKPEKEAGFPIFPNTLSGFYSLPDVLAFVMAVGRVLCGQINLMRGFGLANTSLAFFSNKLLALCESDLPYVIGMTQEGDIETQGRWDFDRKLFASMTAHPKVDKDTKETFAFQCNPLFFPYVSYFYFNEDGVKQREVSLLSINQPTPIHDFAITKRFAIFPETQLVVEPANLVLGRGMPVVCEQKKVPRIGILPRYAESDSNTRWFPVPGFNAMHVTNAWENGDDEVPKMSGVAKIDLEKECEVSRRLYGPGCFGGEPLFVPRKANDVKSDEDEDDGFVVSYVHDENSGQSNFTVMDAKSPNLDIVAKVKLPRRVPYGFHGLFESFVFGCNAVLSTRKFAPVDELEPTNCEVVEGELPRCLNGVYLTNCPKPQYIPNGPLHSLKLSGGQATYCSRHVKTYKYMLEKEAGFPIFPNMLSGFYIYNPADILGLRLFLWRIMCGHINLMRGFGLANTDLAFFSHNLLVLAESDLPPPFS
ncbi:hypothetical protein POTOM_035050 [Populus tomentosa]|uniref:Uncharacterized protein n=1 Tax=Populus tomentosa TaxID=118781 RepID=A0A8X7YY78_POPTO|nr:hypothetical protein POTOM_035050 [Populus tomentosa]